MKQPVKIKFGANGNTMVFDADGNQIPELQHPWFRAYINFLKAYNVDIEKIDYEMPGSALKATVTKEDKHWDWTVKSRWDNAL